MKGQAGFRERSVRPQRHEETKRSLSGSSIIEIPIREIVIGPRHRKDLGDLDALAASIAEGLLQPIGVTPELRLIWGLRRLVASREVLKRETIASVIVRISSIARGEFEENMLRKDLTVSERVAVVDTLRGYGHGGDRRSDRRRTGDDDLLTTGEAAGRVGFCRDDYFRARKVVEAAERDPERYGHLVERMDRTGRIAGAHRELRIALEAEKIRSEPQPLPEGPFRVAVIDVPWQYEERHSLSRRGVTGYPVMSTEEVAALPVPGIMHEDSLIWMWVTNRHLVDGAAAEILRRWGFRPVTLLTWDKGRPGTGVWLRGQTEHAILAVRGKATPPVRPPSTLLRAPRPGDHSVKPDEFYRLVEELCPGSRVELFARRERPGWVCWGSELQGGGPATIGTTHRRRDAEAITVGLSG